MYEPEVVAQMPSDGSTPCDVGELDDGDCEEGDCDEGDCDAVGDGWGAGVAVVVGAPVDGSTLAGVVVDAVAGVVVVGVVSFPSSVNTKATSTSTAITMAATSPITIGRCTRSNQSRSSGPSGGAPRGEPAIVRVGSLGDAGRCGTVGSSQAMPFRVYEPPPARLTSWWCGRSERRG